MTIRCLVLFAATATTAWGQQFVIQNGQNQRIEEAFKQGLERQVAFVIDDIDRTCELTDQQKAKLRLAAKGAVAASMDKYKARMRQLADRMQGRAVGFGNIAFEAPAAEAVADEAQADEGEGDEEAGEEGDEQVEEVVPDPPAVAQVQVARAIELVAGGGFGVQSSVLEEPRWKKAVQSVLTDDQRTQYAVAVARREAFLRRSAVSAFVGRVDQKLLLSDEQRGQLTLLIDTQFGKQLTDQSRRQNGANQFIFWRGGPNGLPGPPIEHAQLKSVLSDLQFTEWKRSFEGQLNMLRRQFGRMPINGVIPGVPLAPPAEVNIEVPAEDDK